MRFFFVSLLFSLLGFLSYAQVNYWFDFFSVNRLYHLARVGNILYAAGKNAILTYNLDDGSVDRLSAQGALSDTSITAMANVNSHLVIGYASGDIDIIKNGKIINIPDIRLNTMLDMDRKKINKIIPYGDYAFMATDFGIVYVNCNSNIILNTVFFYNSFGYLSVKDITILHDTLYALTTTGLYYISLNSNFSDFANWAFVAFSTGRQLDTDGNSLFVSAFQNGNTVVFNFNDTGFYQICSTAGDYRMRIEQNKIFFVGEGILTYSLSGTLLDRVYRYNDGSAVVARDVLIANNSIFVADRFKGLMRDYAQRISMATPFSDNVNFVKALDKKVFFLHKPDSKDIAYGYKAVISIIDDQTTARYLVFDSLNQFITMAIDPGDEDHWFLSSDSVGLVEIKNDHVVKIYNSTNAPFSPTNGYLKITDLKFDDQGNLWMIYNSDNYPVIRLSRDGTWQPLEASAVAAGKSTDRFIFTSQNFLYADMLSNGMMAINLSTGQARLFYPSQKIGKRINTIAEDKDGVLWFSTNDGLGYLTGQDFTASGFKAIRPKVQVQLNDTVIYAYLLDNSRCTRMLVDAGNRKWVTSSSFGVFELAPDGLSEVAHFSVNNGKLCTNFVYDISYDSRTGDLYFITDQGVLAYRNDASVPKQNFSQVKIYPNPVRPGYSGPITITGLVNNTIVKITDVEGDLIYEARSFGGTVVWNGLSLGGHAPASGVYLIMCSDDKGKQKCVKKLLIVR